MVCREICMKSLPLFLLFHSVSNSCLCSFWFDRIFSADTRARARSCAGVQICKRTDNSQHMQFVYYANGATKKKNKNQNTKMNLNKWRVVILCGVFVCYT